MPQGLFPLWRRFESWLRPDSGSTTFAEPSEEDLLAALLAEPPEHERRRAIRHACCVETQCQPIALLQSDPWPVLVRDLSATGVGLVADYPLPPGAFLMLDMPEERQLRGRVVTVREQDDGSWVMGCMLTQPLSDDEVEELV